MSNINLHQHRTQETLETYQQAIHPDENDSDVLYLEVEALVNECMSNRAVVAYGDTITLMDAVAEMDGNQDILALLMLNPATYSPAKAIFESFLRFELKILIERAYYELESPLTVAA